MSRLSLSPRRRAVLLGGLSGLTAASAARAAAFPDRPIRLIAPVPPGGLTDMLARTLAREAQGPLGQPVIIDNRPGAGGTLGPSQMARSARPDGYSISTVNSAVLRLPLMTRADYDPVNDFTYIIRLSSFAYGVLVKPDAPWQSWEELIAYARANPGKIAYGSSGIGSAGHVGMEQLGKLLGIQWLHAPYRGWAENSMALMSGQVQIAADASWGQQVQNGQLRPLIVWSETPLARYPQLRTLRQAGIDLAITLPYGLAGPRGMDPAVVRTLHDAFRAAMQTPEYMQVLDRNDMQPAYLGSEDYARYAAEFYAEQKTLFPSLGIGASS